MPRSIEVYLLTDGKFALDEVYALYPEGLSVTDKEREETKKRYRFHFTMISVFLWKKYSETYFNNEREIEKDKTACTVCENNVRGYCT